MREQQNAPPLGQHLGQHGHQLLQLGRGFDLLRGGQLEQLRVAAHLPELEQRIQNGDLRLGQALGGECVTHGFFHAQADGFVQIGLRTGQLHAQHGLYLGWQLGGHQRLGAAQHERGDAGAQLLQSLGVALLFNGVAKQLGKPLVAAQKARHQKMKQAPDFAQVVFHRCARQAQAVPRLQLAGHLGGVGAGVFDVLCLVQHHQVPLGLQPALAVALQQRVGGNHNVKVTHGVGHCVPIFAVQHQAAQLRAKARSLALPVAHQAHRRNDEGRVGQAPSVFFDLNVGQRLQGFAQAHVVSQDAAQGVLAQKLQPVQALLLVRAQAYPHAGRHGHRGQLGLAA